ncbi:MAG: glycosyltransferase [Candidatus Taylorbacteria bacterium]|nr:glycosyltransferase [Candidatus Taylorbacteria bacterium]
MINSKRLPLISVIMPVHNGEAFLTDAIDSILKQTYTNFELIILSSANTSTESLEIISNFKDSRIYHIRRDANLTYLPAALNHGIDLSKGEYIARMDSDDISLPHRFETQIKFMEEHQEITIAGSYAKTIGRNPGITMRHPLNHEEIRASLLFHSSLIHPTVMMRKQILNELNLRYDPTLERTEDYEFWYRASKVVKIANIPKVLLYYRTHEDQASYKTPEKQAVVRDSICADAFGKLGIPLSTDEKALYENVRQYRKLSSPEDLLKISEWFLKIDNANETSKVYNQKALQKVLSQEWLTYCRLSLKLGKKVKKIFWNSIIRSWIKIDLKTIGRIFKFYFLSSAK